VNVSMTDFQVLILAMSVVILLSLLVHKQWSNQ